jgi:cytochrome c oxidase subunit 6b
MTYKQRAKETSLLTTETSLLVLKMGFVFISGLLPKQSSFNEMIVKSRVDLRRPVLCVAYQVKSSPYDPRFPTTNQARQCYTRYNEFYRCKDQKSEDDEECKFYQKAYRSICPGIYILHGYFATEPPWGGVRRMS